MIKRITILLLVISMIFISSLLVNAQEVTELHGVKTEHKANKTSDIALAGTFVLGQILNTGNMIYSQNHGYYEVNSGYGKHPGKDTIYTIKAIETIGVLGSVWLFKNYRKEILIPANVVVWGMIINDLTTFGVQAKVEF